MKIPTDAKRAALSYDAVYPEFIPQGQTGKGSNGPNVFRDAQTLRAKYGSAVHAKAVQQTLDFYEAKIKAGGHYFDRKGVALEDRAALLEAFMRDYTIYKPAQIVRGRKGPVNGR